MDNSHTLSAKELVGNISFNVQRTTYEHRVVFHDVDASVDETRNSFSRKYLRDVITYVALVIFCMELDGYTPKNNVGRYRPTLKALNSFKHHGSEVVSFLSYLEMAELAAQYLTLDAEPQTPKFLQSLIEELTHAFTAFEVNSGYVESHYEMLKDVVVD